MRTSYEIPRETYEINVMGTVNILECVRKSREYGDDRVKTFLNVTTDKVYENSDLMDHPFKEEEKLDGYDPYSNSKSCSELVTHFSVVRIRLHRFPQPVPVMLSAEVILPETV